MEDKAEVEVKRFICLAYQLVLAIYCLATKTGLLVKNHTWPRVGSLDIYWPAVTDLVMERLRW